jgi:hypothetical protein
MPSNSQAEGGLAQGNRQCVLGKHLARKPGPDWDSCAVGVFSCQPSFLILPATMVPSVLKGAHLESSDLLYHVAQGLDLV